MSTECIHGLDQGRCDSCFPKAVPETPKVAPTRASKRSAPVSTSKKSINVAEQRVYHITHIRNLDAILTAGEIVAQATPTIDVSSELTRELRNTAEVAPGESVANYVPFYLVPNATLWEDFRRGAVEPRWSAAARASTSADFVVLVSTVKALGESAVISNGDAAGSYTRFASGPEVEPMLTRLHNDETAKLEAEALTKESFPFDAVTLIGVSNEPMRVRVREMLDSALFATKVAVYPPWFQAVD